MWDLLLLMFERLGIIVTVAFVMTRFRFVRHVIDQREITRRQRLTVILMFGFFGIVGTYTGLTINPQELTYTRWTLSLNEGEAIANSRVIGIVVAGLLGGWKVGIGAGLIAGFHRFFLGGFTAFSCGISTIIAGALAGYFFKRNKNKRIISLQAALIVGMLAEFIQMLVILIFARPFEQAWILVNSIGVPMIIANGVGAALFILIIRNVVNEEEKIGSTEAQRALRLADLTLKHMRKGLSEDSAKSTCEILLKEVQADAVSITNKQRVLAYIGFAAERYSFNDVIKTIATKRVLENGKLLIAAHEEIQYADSNSPFRAAIIAPLKQKEDPIGTLKFYFKSEKDITPMVIELISGLSTLLSHQLEIAEVDRHQELAKQAEIKALQAQVSPHFLFNALNTIVSLIRTDPMKARKLLVSLSHYFRQNLAGTTKAMASLEEELKHVKAYLAIEEARFVDKLTVRYDVAQEKLTAKVPPMTLQPLVENVLKHGLRPLTTGSVIVIAIHDITEGTQVNIHDNGIGIEQSRLSELLLQPIESARGAGIGLYNVNRRLQIIFGEKAGLCIESKQGQGTTISFVIPPEKGSNHEPND